MKRLNRSDWIALAALLFVFAVFTLLIVNVSSLREDVRPLSTIAKAKVGPQGVSGIQGIPGLDSQVPGPVGPQGPPGAASKVPGPRGATGATGPRGAVGPASPTCQPGYAFEPQGNTQVCTRQP